MVENFIRILANGLSYYKVSFKDIQLDISKDEQDGISDSLSYSAQKKPLNSAELENKKQREKYRVTSYDILDLTRIYKTKAFLNYYTDRILGVSDYLLKVTRLAISINEKVKEICKEANKIKRNKNLTKEDASYQMIKHTVSGYISVLRKINNSIDDLKLDRFCHHIDKNYALAESLARLSLEQSQIPDEMAEEIDSLYSGIKLRKFSDLKGQKNSKTENMKSFSLLADKLYVSVIKLFLSYLKEEFSYYITSDVFLNNPDGNAIFVVPFSKYKMFNFQKSGLYRQELPSTSSQKEKFAEESNDFFTELYGALNVLSEQTKMLKTDIQNRTSEPDVIWLIKEYERHNEGQKGSKLNSIKKMIKDSPVFTEYITSVIYELRHHIVELATVRRNAWEPKAEGTKDDKELDKDSAYFLCHVFQRIFSEKKYPTMKIQTIRFLHMFSYNERPEKTFAIYFNKFNSGNLIWPDTELGNRFKDILDR